MCIFPFQESKKNIMILYRLSNYVLQKKLHNYAIIIVKQQAGQNDLLGHFYLLWFESLKKHLDVSGTKAKQNLWFFENTKLFFTECKQKVMHKDKQSNTNMVKQIFCRAWIFFCYIHKPGHDKTLGTKVDPTIPELHLSLPKYSEYKSVFVLEPFVSTNHCAILQVPLIHRQEPEHSYRA